MKYQLPDLPYKFDELSPFVSEEQLRLHHQKHHQAYVNAANSVLEKIEASRKEGADLEIKSVLKDLSFQVSGHILHTLFWENLKPKPDPIENYPEIEKRVNQAFGSFERFKKEFSQTAQTVEGSGWAVLVFEKTGGELMLMQIEKHNLNLCPESQILLVLDVWEHAYYLDYKNDRAKYIENFWQVVNWGTVKRRLKNL